MFLRHSFWATVTVILLCALSLSASAVQRSVVRVPPTPYNLSQLSTAFTGMKSSSTAALGGSKASIRIACGDNGYCDGNFPICCPHGENPFCISAGERCCSRPTSLSCLQSEVCCDGGEFSVCCGEGTTCSTLSSGSLDDQRSALESQQLRVGATQPPLCKYNNCTRLLSAGLCLNDSSCGWCCTDNRCVEANDFCPSSIRSQLVLPIVGVDATCADSCSYATTCGECVTNSPCTWCCSSQSCSSPQLQNCNEYQLVPTNVTMDVCAACQFGGTGLYHIVYVDGPLGKYATVIAVIICLICITAITAMTRFLFIRYRRQLMGQNANLVQGEWGLETVESAMRRLWESSRGIRQYGIKCTLVPAPEASNPSHRNYNSTLLETVQHEVAPLPVSRVCGICKVALATGSLSGSSGGGGAPPRPGQDHSLNDPSDGTSSGGSTDYVVLLPCGDALCFSCCAQALPKQREELSVPTQRTPTEVMQQLAKLSKRTSDGFQCPCCRTPTKDAIVGKKIVSR